MRTRKLALPVQLFLLGYYPLAKPYFERIRPALLRAVCKLLLCNGGILAMYGLVLLLVPAGSIAEEPLITHAGCLLLW